MKSEWRVTENYFPSDDGERVAMYGVYRLLDVDEVDHSGNREDIGRLFDSQDLAQVYADVMNSGDAV